jgi:anti-sigma factor RsiW
MTACGDIQLLLGPFEDGELRAREMEDVAFHVVGCEGCRAALADYRSLGAAIRAETPKPVLDGFTRAVMARIEQERPPLRARLEEFWESLGRAGSVIQVAAVASASAALTLMVLGPRLKEGMRTSLPIALATQTRATQPLNNPEAASAEVTTVRQLARNQVASYQAAPAILVHAPADTSEVSDEADAAAARDSQELLSQLGGGSGPSVAVWDEPRTGTTVVWVPDQQP